MITSATLLVLRLLGEVTGLDNGTTYERWEDGWMSNRGFSASMKSHAYGRFDMIRRGEAVERRRDVRLPRLMLGNEVWVERLEVLSLG